jgi:hypothetical protein
MKFNIIGTCFVSVQAPFNPRPLAGHKQALCQERTIQHGLGSGNGNSVFTGVWCFDIESPWLENLGFISQGLCITPSQEGAEDGASFWMKETSSGS